MGGGDIVISLTAGNRVNQEKTPTVYTAITLAVMQAPLKMSHFKC